MVFFYINLGNLHKRVDKPEPTQRIYTNTQTTLINALTHIHQFMWEESSGCSSTGLL